PRRLALGPQPLLAAAPKCNFSTFSRRLERLGVHVAEHQHRAAAPMLDDRRQQAAALLPIECRDVHRGFLCGAAPRCRLVADRGEVRTLAFMPGAPRRLARAATP